MTQLPQVLVNIAVGARRPDIAALLADDIAEAQSALGETGRILVRASGTEPLIRVMVEAPTREQAQSTADASGGAACAVAFTVARAVRRRCRATPGDMKDHVEASSVG